MDEPQMQKALKTHDLDPVHKKAQQIVNSGKALVQKQKVDIEDEDTSARVQIQMSSLYYYMTVIQILVVVCLGLYQVYSFRKFLSKNNYI